MLQVSVELEEKEIESMPFRKDYDLIFLEQQQDTPRYSKALTALLALRKAGYDAMYGGRKGDGFWIRICRGDRYRCVLDNTEKTGNPLFIATEDALALAEELPITNENG